MKKIVTLTVNPAIDKSTTVSGIKAEKKLRCSAPFYEAGGGGINVSRVIKELGGTSQCMFLSGGPLGKHIKTILDTQHIHNLSIPIEGWTRENFSVLDTNDNQQFRFGMPGPTIKDSEWKKTLDVLKESLSNGDYLVASGSLSPGMPTDFYLKVSNIAKKANAKLILDTSGEELLYGARAGVYLLKPNLSELAVLCNVKSVSSTLLKNMARECLKEYKCEVLIVSLGAKGALMVTKSKMEHQTAPIVHQQSTIGAGDSMVAGMVYSLLKNKSLSEMLKYGVACGAAATISSGTQLCKKSDVDSLYQSM